MAWTGTPTAKLLGRCIVRITGAVLGRSARGTIGLPGDAGADFQLPSGFPCEPDIPGLTMSDLVHAIAARAEAPSGIPAHYHVAKQEAPFRVLVSNDTGNEVIFEFYVQYLHSLIR